MAPLPAQSQDRVRIQLFGPLTVQAGPHRLGPADWGGVRPKQVLEILLTARGHAVPTARLATLLWADQPPKDATSSLHTFISVLRRRLCAQQSRSRAYVVTERAAYRFATEHAELDLDRFDDLVRQAERAPTETALHCLRDALSVVHGEILEDEPDAAWSQDLRGTYRGRVLGVHLQLAEATLAVGEFRDALTHTQAAVALDRFAEGAHRSMMLALYALGRPHEALAAYQRLRALLASELGLDPTPATQQLHQAILGQAEIATLLPRPQRRMHPTAPPRTRVLLGRVAEMAALAGSVDDALTGAFALVLVEAEAGFGKSQLLAELAARLDGMRQGRASCSPLVTHLRYVPLAAALRQALSAAELAAAARPALAPVLPELAAAEGTGEPAEIDILEALVRLIDHHAPLVLIFDDLHYADPATITALGYLQQRCPRTPVAVIGAIRTDITAEHPVRQLAPTTVIHLGPLSPADLAPLDAADQLHERTGGHPQAVAAALHHHTRADLALAVGELFLARCRAEGPEAYRLLQTAATLDQPFRPDILTAVLDDDPAPVLEQLEHLCDRRLLRVAGHRFAFRYPVLREVFLASLSPARRQFLAECTRRAQHAGQAFIWGLPATTHPEREEP
jgi:DNA-binding SARP family transcriptional activator